MDFWWQRVGSSGVLSQSALVNIRGRVSVGAGARIGITDVTIKYIGRLAGTRKDLGRELSYADKCGGLGLMRIRRSRLPTP